MTRVIVLALAAAAPAEQQPLTLAEAVDRALAASASLAQAQALERAADADGRATRSGRLPQVEVSAGYTRQSDVPELTLAIPGAPPRTIFPNIPDNYRLRLGASLPLYTGGRVSSLIDAADGERTAAGRDVESVRADVVLETTTAYWSLVVARDTERVLTEALAAYDAHLTDARNREAVGMAARNEVLAVQVERDRAELTRLRAAGAAEAALANLVRLVGFPPGTRVVPAEPPVPATDPPEELETLVARALVARPERASLAARVESAGLRAQGERAARLPQLVLSAGYDYANPNRRILPPEARWKDAWDVSLAVTWSVFDGGRASSAVARAEARAEAAERQLEDLDGRIRQQVTERRLGLTTAQAAVRVAESGLAAARENRRVAAERYRAGVVPSSELLDAEVALLRAGLDEAEALAQVRLAMAALDRAVGAASAGR